MYKKLRETEGTRNEAQVYLINKALKKIKEDLKYHFFKNAEKIIKDFKKITDIVERILDFSQLEQKGGELKILTPNQMLSRSPITLAQLNAGNNSEKHRSEIRQLLYSLNRSKKLTKQIYKSSIDII